MAEDLLDNYLKSHSLTAQRILELVDDYSIYTYYLEEELEIGTSYRSPLRDDDTTPSFALFLCVDGKIRFKDHVLGSGDVFDFIGMLLDLSHQEVLQQIDSDLELGITNNTVSKAVKRPINTIKIREHKDIRITSRPFTAEELRYWEQFNIDLTILNRHLVTAVKFIHYIAPSGTKVVSPTEMCFAYRISKYYKLYFPYAQESRFQNNYPSHYIEGLEQLRYKTKTLIITKSRKDIMCLESLGYESVSPRGESIVMPKEYFTYFDKKYARVLVLFDNDGKHKGDSYPYPQISIPIESGCKDISDYVAQHGVENAKKLLKELVND